ncbi:MAG: hypothetical protein ACAH80_08685 [Alphaproteobacteria bacterium]
MKQIAQQPFSACEQFILYWDGQPSDRPAIFIPLKTEYYNRFAEGTKIHELRLYGQRWNERTCKPGRRVTISKGYGKQHRLPGTITEFKKQHGTTFGSTYRADIEEVYGTLNVWIASLRIKVDGVSA